MFTLYLCVCVYVKAQVFTLCVIFTCGIPLQGVDGSGPYGPNPDLDRPPMDEAGIGPDPSGPDNGKSTHPMASGKDAVTL